MSERVEIRNADLQVSCEGFAGVVVPYGELSFSTEYGVRGERFVPGAFAEAELAVASGSHIPLWLDHDGTRRPAGYVTKLQEAPGGLVAAFRVYDSPEGREAQQAVAEGRGGLSVGFVTREEARGNRGERVVVAATLVHVALVAAPAYASARAEPVFSTRGSDLGPVRLHLPPGIRLGR